jgi:hypothetical protein
VAGFPKDFLVRDLPARFAPWSAVAAATCAATGTAAGTESAATAAAESAATTAAFSPGTSFVYVDLPAAHIGAVESRNGALRLAVIRHFHESETARTPGIAIRDQADAFDRPVRFEQCPNTRFRCAEIQIAYENILHFSLLILDKRTELGRLESARLVT